MSASGLPFEPLPPPGPALAATVDVEDWYHGNFRSAPKPDEKSLPSAVESGVDRALEMLEGARARATFFVLGAVARAHPGLVARVAARGHEIGCHGMTHDLVYEQDPDVFRAEVARARRLLMDQSGQEVLGFRAPSCSITRRSFWAFDALAAAGFRYDSSVFPFENYLYGVAGAPRQPSRVRAKGGDLIELPPSVLSLGPMRCGVGGGFYLRALPLWAHRWAVRDYARRGWPFVAYFHPRELDPEAWTHRLPLGVKERFIHEFGLRRGPAKAARLLGEGKWEPIGDILERGGLLS